VKQRHKKTVSERKKQAEIFQIYSTELRLWLTVLLSFVLAFFLR